MFPFKSKREATSTRIKASDVGLKEITPDEVESKAVILERKKLSEDVIHRQKLWNLRMVASNVLDITTAGTYSYPRRTEGNYGDVEPTDVELGRHNAVTANIDVLVQSLSFGAPDIAWRFVHQGKSLVRRAWYLDIYERQDHRGSFQMALADMLISGDGNIVGGVRDGEPFIEYADALDCQWDNAFKEPHLKRFVYHTRHIPLSVAAAAYPELAKIMHYKPGDTGGEKIVDITNYWSKNTRAVLYKDAFIVEPRKNEYGRIPIVQKVLTRRPSLKYSKGIVEDQLGSLQTMFRCQRALNEIALRAGSPVGVARGKIQEPNIDRLESGEEAVILRFADKDGDFEWKEGAREPSAMLKLYEMTQANLQAESGVDPFMLSQTDVQVDFASQLSFMAGRSGVRGKAMALAFEELVKDSIQLLMDIGRKFAPPVALYVGDTEVDFETEPLVHDGGQTMNALQAMLGSDGEIIFKPGAMEYQSPAQKLQQVMVFGQVLQGGLALPEDLQPYYVDLACRAYEVDDPEEWSQAIKNTIDKKHELAAAQAKAQMIQEQQQQAQAAQPQPQPTAA
jgi:hypothetical protein